MGYLKNLYNYDEKTIAMSLEIPIIVGLLIMVAGFFIPTLRKLYYVVIAIMIFLVLLTSYINGDGIIRKIVHGKSKN